MSYAKLDEHFGRVGQLEEVSAIVGWDQAVNMPPAAGANRAQALAGLTRVTHELLAAPEVGEWIAAAEAESLDPWQRANVREIARKWRRATAVPSDLVQAAARADKISEQAWREHRKANDFAAFAPHLETVIGLKRRVGEALAAELGCTPYEALADEFEPGIRVADIDAAFAPLKQFLPEFTQQAIEHQRSHKLVSPVGPYPVAQQRALGLAMMRAVGFAMDQGRLDVSHHPFCGGVPRDVRITTRYDEADFTSALMGVLHEAGHGKYEQGLPDAWLHQPVGLARGMVLHESQSLLQEMQVCRGRQFLSFALPHVHAAFPERVAAQPEAYTVDNLTALYCRVEPGLIRVDADEVTYPAHVALRYDLERQLIEGSLAVADLPAAWDAEMRRYLGISTLGNDRDGCMQDVHWPSGAFGYFPLYTLGAMVAAQLFARARAVIPGLLTALENGEFTALNRFLAEHVWSRASSVSTAQLLTDATGEALNPGHFIAHLRQRYLS